MILLRWIVVPSILLLNDICASFDIGSEDFTWPGSTWDDLPVGYGYPGWEPPLAEFPQPLHTPFEPIVHNHFHHIVPGPEGLPPHGLINGPLYQHFPSGHHHHGHLQPTRDWYCHHAKKMKHVKKWLAKMLFCGSIF